MNTDNMLLSGETIDYGPCAFMDTYHPETVYSSIDHQGRYAYLNQPPIAHWNLARLAQALMPLMHDDPERSLVMAQESLDTYPECFEKAYGDVMARKLGLSKADGGDAALAADFLELLRQERADFTLAFRRLSDRAGSGDQAGVGSLFEFSGAFDTWLARWEQRLASDEQPPDERQASMYRANPAFIPRNHLVAAAIDAAVGEADFTLFNELVDLLEKPRDFEPGLEEYARPPRPEEIVSQTFCGT
jgi:uncharacterized protein YdiU (UPF0061 family)